MPTLAEAGIKGSDVDMVRPHRARRHAARDRAAARCRRAQGPGRARPATAFRRAQPVGDAELAEELDALIKSEAVRWGEIIHRAGIKAPA